MIQRLMSINFEEWNYWIQEYSQKVIDLKVPNENTAASLQQFNIETERLYTEVQMKYSQARANRDAIQRFIKNVLEDAYEAKNESLRRAGGIQYATSYPYSAESEMRVNLFDLEYTFNAYYYQTEAMVKSLEAKMNAKITNNSLLNLERSLMPQ